MIRIEFPEVSFPIQGLDEVILPRMVRVRQLYAKDRIEDIPAHLKAELSRNAYAPLVKGKRIAVTVGSRGIPDNAVLVRTICSQLKEWGAEPFVVPAMAVFTGMDLDVTLSNLRRELFHDYRQISVSWIS